MNKARLVFSLFLMSVLMPSSSFSMSSSVGDGTAEKAVGAVAVANNEFAVDMYSRLAKSADENVFFSPYSMFAALAMTFEGASGKTADEIKNVFRFPERAVLRTGFSAFQEWLNGKNKEYELKSGNALWVQRGLELRGDYLMNVDRYYKGEAKNLDFRNEAEKSRGIINRYIEKQTNDKIKELIPQGVLGPDTSLVLTNAVYFMGNWQFGFDAAMTAEGDFTTGKKGAVKAPMMNMNPKENFAYMQNAELQALLLPYKGRDISMLILLPADGLQKLESGLSAKKIGEYVSLLAKRKLARISIPKFEFDSKYFMRKTLSEMGMQTAFTGMADFSGITDKASLFISDVIHQAYVKVDEKGTEAAAATAVLMDKSAAMIHEEPPSFIANRPFVFVIMENRNGNILFMGRVSDPVSYH